ncbi:hypothetical protein L5515_014759 [Caenorhabditis briggsae]|uniref:Uncharacterized protein n=1 Tax=Caenorhabditis briggsae TaxID=6238 RepID=A0AAE9EA07_CAEBR|nr:hypothetical protein L3Y34_018640 [Caenorhabditis briggsae]UMM18903.1 hypothetical protein L5515_014759 [Caenorhabditis briggsae]
MFLFDRKTYSSKEFTLKTATFLDHALREDALDRQDTRVQDRHAVLVAELVHHRLVIVVTLQIVGIVQLRVLALHHHVMMLLLPEIAAPEAVRHLALRAAVVLILVNFMNFLPRIVSFALTNVNIF